MYAVVAPGLKGIYEDPKVIDKSYAVEGWIPIGSDLHIGRKESPYVTNIF